jgi:hypothetical protein
MLYLLITSLDFFYSITFSFVHRYRSGYATKDSRQTNILALRISHKHFTRILSLAAVTSGHSGPLPASERAKPVRVQWDPERAPDLAVLPYRSLQVGIGSNDNARSRRKAKTRNERSRGEREHEGQSGSGGEVEVDGDEEGDDGGMEAKELKRKWVDQWVVSIEDVTDRARKLKEAVEERRGQGRGLAIEEAVALGLMPVERVYEVSDELRRFLQMDRGDDKEGDEGTTRGKGRRRRGKGGKGEDGCA